MSGESRRMAFAPSNFGTDKSVRKKLRPWEKGISFRDLARFASPRKTDQFLAALTGTDPRTARRWLSGESRATGDALRALTADILHRIKV